jgi:DNA-binding protein HU-beta
MNKQELIDAISNESGTTKTLATEIVDAFMANVTKSVAKGETVQLVGFGSFSPSARAERAGRNPATGATITIPASTAIRFSPGKAFKDLVNPPANSATRKK